MPSRSITQLTSTAVGVRRASGIPVGIPGLGFGGETAAAPDAYAANSFSPDYVADFSATDADYFRVAGSDSTFAEAFTSDSEGGGLATQVDSSGNLVWRAHNLLTYSSDIDNGSGWSGVGATASGNTVTSTSGTGGHSWGRASPEISDAQRTTLAAKIAPGTHDFIYLILNAGSGRYAVAVFDLSSAGAVTQTATGGTSGTIHTTSVTDLGDGSFLCLLEASVTSLGGAGNTAAVGFAEAASGNTLLVGGRVDWQSAAAGTETFDLDFAYAYRSDLGGMADNPDAATGLEKYVPTTTAARYLARRRHHRWDGAAWVPTCLHEPVGATNQCRDSRTFDGTGWTSFGSPGIAKNETGIDGQANTATTITDNASGAFEGVYHTSSVAGGTQSVTTSVRVKKTSSAASFPGIQITGGGGLNVGVTINTDAGTLADYSGRAPTAKYIVDEGDWWAVTVVATNASDTSQLAYLWPAVNTDGSGTWSSATTGSAVFDQLDVVDSASIPSSPIITNGSTVTRTADTLKGKAASLPYSSTAMSLAAAGRVDFDGDDTERVLSWVSNASNRILLYRNVTGGEVRTRLETGGVVADGDAGTFSTGVAVDVSIASRVVASSAVQTASMGAAGTADTSGVPAMAALSSNDLSVFVGPASTQPANGTIDTIRLWDEDIAEAGIEEATA